MNFADHFNQALRQYENVYRLPPLAKSIRLMEETKEEVENKLKDAEMGEPNPELVRLTIMKFFDWARNPAISFNWLEVALICRGLLTEISGFGSLMKSESAVNLLLTNFAKKYQSQILNPYPWQGFLNAYLNCSSRGNAIEIGNREVLRKFLSASLNDVFNYSSFKPRWLEAISKHRIILEENATLKLAKEALDERRDRVESIAREVNIPSTSWFWPELLMSQIEFIEKYPDDRFKATVDILLPQLKTREECIDDGLARILDRYSSCGSKEEHQELKSMAIECWKNPSLEKQRDWERVSLDAKKMVQQWLVREDIEDVFKKLVDDHRRYEFWLQFLEQIEYTFVWLGRDAQYDFPHLLKNRRERCALLSHPGKPDNNVLLIKIKNVFIIESGAKAGGKCWAYGADKILPLLQKRSLNYEVFRDPNRNLFTGNGGWSNGLAHQGGIWEQRFHSALEQLGIRPDTVSFEAFIDRYDLKLEPLPSGTQRVKHPYEGGVIAEFLKSHDFEFKTSVGAFVRNVRSSATKVENAGSKDQYIESHCPKCFQKLRFPSGKKLKITCPTCRHEFYSS